MKPIINGHEIAGRMPLFQQWGRDAIREGRKTQTRRIIKPQPPSFTSNGNPYTGFQKTTLPCVKGYDITAYCDNPYYIGDSPYKIGDIYVMTEPLMNTFGFADYSDDCCAVRIGTLDNGCTIYLKWRWKRHTLSAMHMPHEAARTLCRITDIRVERVQDISEVDAVAEGCVLPKGNEDLMLSMFKRPYRQVFIDIWDSIHNPGAWERNDYVWAYTFEVVK
jgi:hypothetical protein